MLNGYEEGPSPFAYEMESLSLEIALTPSGRPAGLLALAATTPNGPLSPSLSFWRDFSCRYLTLLCRTPVFTGDSIDPIAPPEATEMAHLLFAAPPMQGGEYLNGALLQEIWVDLDRWVRKDIASAGGGLSGWMKSVVANLTKQEAWSRLAGS